MLSKECKHCKENKSLDKFHANKKGKFGVHSVCKVCKNKRDAERLRKDKPRMARNYKKYVDNNPHAKIDHIIPCAAFDLTKPENQKKCFHYSNTQPLWAKDNLRKGDKYVK